MATKLDKYAYREPSWDTPVIIESHINGERTKEMNPHTPRTSEEVIEDAIRCWDAGACAIHVHNTDFDLVGKEAADDYLKTWKTILEKRPDMIWYPTTCERENLTEGMHGLDHVPYLVEEANVKIGCVDTGIELFGTDVDDEGYMLGRPYGFNLEQIAAQIKMLRSYDMPMIFGVYQPGFARVAMHYINKGMVTEGSFWDFYLVGDYGLTSTKPIGTQGMRPTLESLYYYLHMIEEAQVDLNWCISIWGEGSNDAQRRSIIRRTIELGGHIKTGLELHYDPNSNKTNLELLQEAQEIAREVGRPIATQEEARKIYNID